MLLLNETWNASRKNVNIDGYDCFNFPRPKSNSKAKRCSGGVIVYYKSCYKNYFHLLNIDNKGILWFKLDKQFLQSDKDAYFCICYIPPEDSAVYRNINSVLYDFDFYECLDTEIRKYCDKGNIFLLGDLNSRTSNLPDYITDLNLERYVDLPESVMSGADLPPRKNHDNGFNNYGSKLLSLCKGNNL